MMLVRQIGIRLGPVLFYKQTGATSRFHLWNQAPDLVNVEICRTMDEFSCYRRLASGLVAVMEPVTSAARRTLRYILASLMLSS
jgi:hypothetical protein